MALTGWTFEELRAQPAAVVRGMMHRALALRTWNPELVATARQQLPPGRLAPESHADAVRAKLAAEKQLAPIEAALWPEGDDARP